MSSSKTTDLLCSYDPSSDPPVKPPRPAGVRPPDQARGWQADGYEPEVVSGMRPDARGRRLAGGGRRADAQRQLRGLEKVRGAIAVMSCSGGVGKSTLSVALAGILYASGHGPLALVDCDPELAGLSLLAGDGGRMTRVLSQPDTDPTEHRTVLASGVDLYATGHHPDVLQLLYRRPEIMRRVAERLRETYPLVILDIGAGMQTPGAHMAAQYADVVVLVTRATVAAAVGAIHSYRQLRSTRGLVDDERPQVNATTVVAAVNNVATDRQNSDLALLVDELLGAGLDSIVIPADSGIETGFEEGFCDPALVAEPARDALLALALTATMPLAHPPSTLANLVS